VKTSLGAKTMLYPTPVLVVGTYGPDGRPNVMVAAWGGVACSKPPCVSISLRSATASHANIMERKAFTLSVPGEDNVAQADYFGTVSGRDHDKFTELGLTAVPSDLVDAPYVGEFPLVLECSLVEVHELGLHTQFIGEVKDAKIEETCLGADGHVDVAILRPIIFAMDPGAYFGLGANLGKAWSIGKDLVGGA
jgi:flavin reductase (DIM6/NTAB) family NADH-FMN oxidoreductase RutF